MVKPVKIRPAFADIDEGPDQKMVEKKALHEGGIRYCEQTSLHGWQYIPTEEWYLRKIYWWIVCIGKLMKSLNSVMKIIIDINFNI